MEPIKVSTFTSNTLSTIAFRVRLSPINKRTKEQKALNNSDFNHIESFMGKTSIVVENREQKDFMIQSLKSKLNSGIPFNNTKEKYKEDIKTLLQLF